MMGTVGIEFSLLESYFSGARDVFVFMIDPTSATQGFWTAMALYRAIDAVANTPNPASSFLVATTVADSQPQVFDIPAVLLNPELLSWLTDDARCN